MHHREILELVTVLQMQAAEAQEVRDRIVGRLVAIERGLASIAGMIAETVDIAAGVDAYGIEIDPPSGGGG